MWIKVILYVAIVPALLGPPVVAYDANDAKSAATTFEHLGAQARELAGRPYVADDPADALPDWMKEMDYDAYAHILYRREKALWTDHEAPFRVHFFHRGYLFTQRVEIDELIAGAARPVRFSPDLFEYLGKLSGREAPADWGFSGFKLLYPLNQPEKFDELISFQGASYFRALGKGQFYGVSARGLAIRTGHSEPEEFPRFRHFWIERPAVGSDRVTVFALLDGRETTGAYQFEIQPGEDTVIDVRARLFARGVVEHVGFAPLTSMYFYGEDRKHPKGDERPEIHDSDGLLLAAESGEWLWRPLRNPRRVALSRFTLPDPRGFGLMQRDREFEHYRDRQAQYHARPSVWIEPLDNWPPGTVDLVELPVDGEDIDNIVAFWALAKPLQPGETQDVAYRLRYSRTDPAEHTGGKAVATRVTPTGTNSARLEIDFRGGELGEPHPDRPTPRAEIAVRGGQVARSTVAWDAERRAWRVTLDLSADSADDPVELRAFLRLADKTLTETWSYQWSPQL